jgi:hypothetical protein
MVQLQQKPEHQTETKALGLLAPEQQMTVAYAAVNPGQSPNMRQSTRWNYLSEYIGYWIDHKRYLVYAVVFAGAGIWALHTWAPIGLLMIMVAAKFKTMSWMDNFIIKKFGANRSLVLVD